MTMANAKTPKTETDAAAKTPAKTDDKVTGQAADVAPELVSPEEHAETTEELEDGESVVALDNDAETAARSADMDEPGNEHVKAFVLGGLTRGGDQRNPFTEANGFDHEPNYAATRQGAINAGLWPTGDVRFAGAKRHPDKTSWILTYKVPVEPAHDIRDEATHPEVVADDTDNDGASKAANAEPLTGADDDGKGTA